MNNSYATGAIMVSEKQVPLVATKLDFRDFLGSVRVRLGIKRNKYSVDPGLYAVGEPGKESDVFVTANYKLSFDALRKNLAGLNAWILVLDTKGVNVWCAAGKKTFGTKELVSRIKQAGLDNVVNHRRIILPQLGATGVAAYKLREETGFNVHYGPVRAVDIKKYLEKGYKADPEMRKVTFSLKDRIKLIPNDFLQGYRYLLGALAIVILISCINGNIGSFKDFIYGSAYPALNILLAYFSGIVIAPVLLPVIPGKYFSFKGFLSGAVIYALLLMLNLTGTGIIEKISWFFVLTSLSSFITMNFTGSSTFTSLSGVKKEMKKSVPLQIGFASIGVILMVTGKLIQNQI
jgi:acetyl-CoA decarbonylase/synthase complex subunit gamma